MSKINKITLLIAMVFIVLAGCSTVESSESKSESPVDVLNRLSSSSGDGYSNVSESFLEYIRTFAKDEKIYVDKIEKYEEKLNQIEESELQWEKEFRNEYSAVLDEYSLHLSNYFFESDQDIEYKIATYMNAYSQSARGKSVHMREYLDTLSSDSLEKYNESKSEATTRLYEVVNTLSEDSSK